MDAGNPAVGDTTNGMNRHVIKIIEDAKDIQRQGWVWYREQPKWRQVSGALVFGVLILTLIISSTGDPADVAVEKVKRSVSVAPVSELANTDSNLPLLGTVTSVSEATIRSESSGKLTRVHKKLGDYVVAGQIIAEFENSGERAAVLQAEGAYDAAKVARDIARINSSTTRSSLAEAETNALNVISGAYNSMDDAIRVKTDIYFQDARFPNAKLLPAIPDAQLVYSIETQRKAIEKTLTARSARNKVLTTGYDLIAELNTVQSELQLIKTYLDDFFSALDKAVPDTAYSETALDNAKTSVSVARSAIVGSISSITSTRTTLKSSFAAEEVAGKTTGNSTDNLTAVDAAVKQALGAYNAALSRLEKTIIRSPITGTLNSLSVETGDFISAFTEVAVVSNNGALEVLAYTTEEDARRIRVGNEVMIDGSIKGIVTRVASAIDPRTKKIEVRVGITDKAATLTNGQSVRVNITKEKQAPTTLSEPIKIPLSALKLTPNGAFVFTVSATSSLTALPVKEGAILGEEIQILSGLNGTESIVTDARGLKAGMEVTVK